MRAVEDGGACRHTTNHPGGKHPPVAKVLLHRGKECVNGGRQGNVAADRHDLAACRQSAGDKVRYGNAPASRTLPPLLPASQRVPGNSRCSASCAAAAADALLLKPSTRLYPSRARLLAMPRPGSGTR